jgi:beta-ureidopropionase / N-carbamoyl-L-amino-acid hydrolase
MAAEIPQSDAGAVQDHVDTLAAIREPGEEGWTRRVLTDEAAAARDEVARRMRAAGLECSVDGAGNLIGVLPGRSGGPALVTGSHTDTVLGGGRYDGIVGVFGAIEAVAALARAGIRLEHDLAVVDFYGEEANRFGLSCLGSRALAGNLTRSHLDRTDPDGRSLGEAMAAHGIDPHAALSCDWRSRDLKAFVELHIEQGPVLESSGCAIGIVSEIAAITRAELTFHGRRDHAGTMPIALRHDAACAAAESVLAAERLGQDGGISAAGRMSLLPGSANVVPETAHLTVEFRSPDSRWIADRRAAFEEAARQSGERRGVAVSIQWISDEPPVRMTKSAADAIAAAARVAGHPTMELPSGAGHDTVHMASLTSVGMIFVPSRDGRSHCPEEFTEAPDIVNGIQVLANTLVELDRS